MEREQEILLIIHKAYHRYWESRCDMRTGDVCKDATGWKLFIYHHKPMNENEVTDYWQSKVNDYTIIENNETANDEGTVIYCKTITLKKNTL